MLSTIITPLKDADSCFELRPRSNKHSPNPAENSRSADINGSIEHKARILIESFFFVKMCIEGRPVPRVRGFDVGHPESLEHC